MKVFSRPPSPPPLPKQIIFHIFLFLHVGHHIKSSCFGKGGWTAGGGGVGGCQRAKKSANPPWSLDHWFWISPVPVLYTNYLFIHTFHLSELDLITRTGTFLQLIFDTVVQLGFQSERTFHKRRSDKMAEN